MGSQGVLQAAETHTPFDWKRVLIKAAGFGAGFCLTLTIVVVAGMWYESQPKTQKPWDEKTIAAKWSGLEYQRVGDEMQLRYTYAFHNTLASDYHVAGPPSGELMQVNSD